MQLKRDTDYALRLLLRLREKAALPEQAISLRELSAETGIPFRIGSRILENLKEKNVVSTAEAGKGMIGYYLHENARQLSLYDLIAVTEGNAELFATFSKSDPAYRLCRETLQVTETEIKNCLSHVTLSGLLENAPKEPG